MAIKSAMSASQGSAKAIPRVVPRIQSPSPTHLPFDIKYKIRYTPPRIAMEVKGLSIISGANEELERISHSFRHNTIIAQIMDIVK